jgi:hypothetical protein
MDMSRRGFVETLTLAGGGAMTFSGAAMRGDQMSDETLMGKIRRARLSGPSMVTAEATVAEMDAQGNLSVLHQGTNQWICFPGNENVIGDVPMSLDPMGMQWYRDLRARKPKPTNATPGLIFMLCGATQRSYSDPFDTTSPAIPIGTRVGNAGRRNDGDVCGHAVGTPSYLWFAVGWKRIPLGRSRRLDDVLRPLLMPRDENMMPIHDKLIVSILRYCEIAGVMHLSISTVVDAVRRATVKLAREFDTKVSL